MEQKITTQQGLLKPGISNGWKRNRQYEQLIIETGIGMRSSAELLTLYFESVGNPPKSKSIHNFSSFQYSKWIQNIRQIMKDFVIRWFENKWPVNKICTITNLSKQEYWLICKENAHNKKIAERRLRDSRLPYSINQNHIDKATKFLKSNSINKVSVEDVRTYLLSEQQGEKLSKTGVHYLMTKILKYSYKKAHKIPRKMATGEKARDFIESAYLQLYLEQEGYKLIYLGEFHVSMKSRSANN